MERLGCNYKEDCVRKAAGQPCMWYLNCITHTLKEFVCIFHQRFMEPFSYAMYEHIMSISVKRIFFFSFK